MEQRTSPTDHAAEVVVLDESEAVRSALASQLAMRTSVTHGGAAALHDLITGGRPAVVVLGPSFANDSALKLIEGANLGAHGDLVVLVAPVLDIDLMRSALGAGLSEVIATDEVATRLASVVERLVARLARDMAGDAPQDEPSGEVIAVVGAKGGVGVTTVAVNLAAELAGRDRRVALIDADLQFGDVAVTMGLGRSSTLRDAVELGTRLNPFALQSMMASHTSNVMVLPGPTDPSAADLIRPVDVARVIRCAATLADIVIVDVPPGLNELGLEILDGADRIVLVLAPDVANLKNARLEIDMLTKLHLAAKTKVIVNRVGPTGHASPRRIEHHLGLHIAGQIRESAEIRVAETTSTPFVTGARRSHAAKAFRAICEDLVPSGRAADDHGRLVASRG